MPIIADPLKHCQDELTTLIQETLRLLRISGTLDGHHYLTFSIKKTVYNPMATCWITKELYIDTAIAYRTKISCVERSIRMAVRICWERGGRETLDQMAGYHLTERPTNSEFIDLVAAYIRNK